VSQLLTNNIHLIKNTGSNHTPDLSGSKS